jgi:hypothetical protein
VRTGHAQRLVQEDNHARKWIKRFPGYLHAVWQIWGDGNASGDIHNPRPVQRDCARFRQPRHLIARSIAHRGQEFVDADRWQFGHEIFWLLTRR